MKYSLLSTVKMKRLSLPHQFNQLHCNLSQSFMLLSFLSLNLIIFKHIIKYARKGNQTQHDFSPRLMGYPEVKWNSPLLLLW